MVFNLKLCIILTILMLFCVPSVIIPCQHVCESPIHFQKESTSSNLTNVTLTYIQPDLAVLNRIITVIDGQYIETFKPESIGSWRVKASWKGDPIYEGASGLLVFFDVKAYLEVRCVDGDKESLRVNSEPAKFYGSSYSGQNH